MAILQFVDNLAQAINNGNHSVGIFFHFSKAFGTVDFHILLRKLSHYDVKLIVLN